jgi:hypothetical protein
MQRFEGRGQTVAEFHERVEVSVAAFSLWPRKLREPRRASTQQDPTFSSPGCSQARMDDPALLLGPDGPKQFLPGPHGPRFTA